MYGSHHVADIQRVLVTGASGKLGAPVCAALAESGYQVTATRHRLPVEIPGVAVIPLDLRDSRAVEAAVADQDAILHLATCKEDREGVIDVSARGTFYLLDAAMRGGRCRRFVLASGDAVNGIYFHDQPQPIREDMPLAAYPGYYPLSKVLEEAMVQQYFHQYGLATVILRMSWIHTEDDILNHLTVAGENFGIPVWSELMDEQQKARYAGGRDAAVALRHPDGRSVKRHIVALEDCVQAHLLALQENSIAGQVFMIAMDQPFDYVEAARYAGEKMGIDVIELVDSVARDFYIDVAKARHVLGYRPRCDIFRLIDQAIEFRRVGRNRRERSGYRG
jgi:nucleoside-diphosphate-sugar epimerase